MYSNEHVDIDDIHLIHDYKNNKVYRDSFNQLAALVFDISFEDWYQKGFWDDRYICHSFIRDHAVIANVSVSKMDLRINGFNRKAIQIGTVMTHPDFRGKGLSGKLMRHILNIYEQECDLFFLFANNSVLDFYPKFRFESCGESQLRVKYHHTPSEVTALRKLNCSSDEDVALIQKMVLSRRPVSEQFGVRNGQGLFMFYALKVFPESIYYSQEDEAIIVYQQEGRILNLYDIVSPSEVDFNRIFNRIADEQTEYIHFHFTPNQIIENAEVEWVDIHGDQLFIKSNFTLSKHSKFCVPALAHT